MPALPPGALQDVSILTWKTLSKRFQKILAYHKIASEANAVAWGINEVRGEREILLDDISLAVDEYNERRRSEREERTEQDRRFACAG